MHGNTGLISKQSLSGCRASTSKCERSPTASEWHDSFGTPRPWLKFEQSDCYFPGEEEVYRHREFKTLFQWEPSCSHKHVILLKAHYWPPPSLSLYQNSPGNVSFVFILLKLHKLDQQIRQIFRASCNLFKISVFLLYLKPVFDLWQLWNCIRHIGGIILILFDSDNTSTTSREKQRFLFS